MRALHHAAWTVIALVLVAIVLSVLTDPYFDRFSERPGSVALERDGATRPLWRTPAVTEPIVLVAAAFLLLLVIDVRDAGAVRLVPAPPFIPPRS
jgi:hypothetical protein